MKTNSVLNQCDAVWGFVKGCVRAGAPARRLVRPLHIQYLRRNFASAQLSFAYSELVIALIGWRMNWPSRNLGWTRNTPIRSFSKVFLCRAQICPVLGHVRTCQDCTGLAERKAKVSAPKANSWLLCDQRTRTLLVAISSLSHQSLHERCGFCRNKFAEHLLLPRGLDIY